MFQTLYETLRTVCRNVTNINLSISPQRILTSTSLLFLSLFNAVVPIATAVSLRQDQIASKMRITSEHEKRKRDLVFILFRLICPFVLSRTDSFRIGKLTGQCGKQLDHLVGELARWSRWFRAPLSYSCGASNHVWSSSGSANLSKIEVSKAASSRYYIRKVDDRAIFVKRKDFGAFKSRPSWEKFWFSRRAIRHLSAAQLLLPRTWSERETAPIYSDRRFRKFCLLRHRGSLIEIPASRPWYALVLVFEPRGLYSPVKICKADFS